MQQISKRPTQLHKENPKHLRPSPCPSVSSVDQKDVPRVSSRNETEWYWRLWRNLGNSMPWQSRAVVPRWRRKVTRTVSKCNQGSVRAYVWDDGANFGRPQQTNLPTVQGSHLQIRRLSRYPQAFRGQKGDRMRPVAYRRDLHRLKKCPLKILNSRRHKNRYRANRQDRTNFSSRAKQSFTGDSRGPHTHRETT